MGRLARRHPSAGERRPGAARRGRRDRRHRDVWALGGFGRYQAGGGGFLAGAMQTALGVAGGFLVADAISGLFADEAAAAVPATPEHDPALAEEDPLGGEDLSGDAGGDLDFDAF
jgi:hypothetical protein